MNVCLQKLVNSTHQHKFKLFMLFAINITSILDSAKRPFEIKDTYDYDRTYTLNQEQQRLFHDFEWNATKPKQLLKPLKKDQGARPSYENFVDGNAWSSNKSTEPIRNIIERMSPSDVAKLTITEINSIDPKDIASLSDRIVYLSPEAFKALSDAQTACLTEEQLLAIFSKPELAKPWLARYLKIQRVNDQALVRFFRQPNTSEIIMPDYIAKNLTIDQLNAINQDEDSRVVEYFNEVQLKEIQDKITSQADLKK